MSVIRGSGLFDRNTRHRIIGVTAAASAATVETLTVGLWFAVVVVEPRTAPTALVGLCILFCGSLLRASVYEATTAGLDDLFQPDRVAVALLFTAGWICWLLVAETLGGELGVAVAGVALCGVLSVQLGAETRVFGPAVGSRRSANRRAFAIPALLVALGATILLGSTWFIEWAAATAPLSLGFATVAVQVEAFQLGYLAFGLFAFLAHQQRFRRALEP